MRRIVVVPYHSGWQQQAEVEARRIKAALGDALIAIHHIGSTAIPGIVAKPTLDLLGEARDLTEIDRLTPQMQALGYEPCGENGVPGRRYFVKYDGEEHSHHVHIFRIGDPELERHLNFRDYLIAHPNQARRYSELKEELARTFSDDPESYTEGKTSLIQELDQRAKEWRERNRREK